MLFILILKTFESANQSPFLSSDVRVIENTIFQYIFSFNYGSAIYYSSSESISLTVKNSYFQYCIGSKEGGTIYFSSKSFNVVNSCFDGCYSLESTDNVYGIVIYSDTDDVSIQRNAFFYCGPPHTESGDSTQYFMASKSLKIEYLNNTECNNKWGTVGPMIDGSMTQKCTAKYLSVVSGASYHIVAQIYTCSYPCDFYYFNTINTTASYSQFSFPIQAVFYSSYIYLNNQSYTISPKISFSNCFGNLKLNGFISTAVTVTAQYLAKRGDNCIMLMKGNIKELDFMGKLVVLSSLLNVS